jgi:hypothetical protein
MIKSATMKDPYIQAMFGMSAVQIPLHGIVQLQDDGKGTDTIIFVSASKMPSPHPFRFGSKLCHQLFWGDAVFRPRLVCETSKLIGSGVAGLLMSSQFVNASEWERVLVRDGIPV